MKKSVKFYMVPSSPWTYLSIYRLKNLSIKYSIDVNLIPIDIFKIFKKLGTKLVSKRPLPIQKNRLNELERWKKLLNVELNLKPKYFPVNPEKANRLIIACNLIETKTLTYKLAERLCRAVWADNLNIDDETILFMILKDLGITSKVEKLYLQNEVKKILDANTENAEKDEIFGVPSFIYKRKMYWGQDRLFFLEKELM